MLKLGEVRLLRTEKETSFDRSSCDTHPDYNSDQNNKSHFIVSKSLLDLAYFVYMMLDILAILPGNTLI